MNKKLIISTILAAVIPVSSVFAANFTDTSVKVADDNKGIVVSGKVDASVNNVVIKVMEPGYSDNTVGAKVKGVSVIDMYGKTDFTETFNFLDELASGRYNIYLSGDGLTSTEPLELWYQQKTDQETLVGEINASQDLLTDVFGDYNTLEDGNSYDRADELSLKNSYYKDGVYDAKVAELLAANENDTYEKLKNNFNIASAIAAFENSTFDWIDSDKKLTVNIWAEDDATMGKAQEHFNDTLSATGRQRVIDALSGKTYASFTDFYKAFSKEVIYNGIFYSVNTGVDYCNSLILQIGSATGYDFSSYTGLEQTIANQVMLDVRQSGATDFDTMTTALSNIIAGLGATPPTENTTTGGGGGGGTPMISGTPPAYIPGVAQTPSTSGEFSDIGGVEWAKDAIAYLKEKNIISGTGEGTFEPNRAVKREEFIKMLITALEIKAENSDTNFSDVDKNAWYAPYIGAALDLEITTGMGDGSFGIGTALTREQGCAFIYRACKDRDFSGEEKSFGDADEVSEYAKESVKALSSAGIIVGDENGNFNPKDNITRAQTAVMIYRLILGGNA